MTPFDTCYIVISEYGIQRMTKRRGQLHAGEVAVKIAITLPEDAFDEPEADAIIRVPRDALRGPDVIVTIPSEDQ